MERKEKGRKQGKEVEKQGKFPRSEVMLEMAMQMCMKESAAVIDRELFEKLVGKKVVIKETGTIDATLGTLVKHGEHFIELEDVTTGIWQGSAKETAENVEKNLKEPEFNRDNHISFEDRLILNKSEIGRIAPVEE